MTVAFRHITLNIRDHGTRQQNSDILETAHVCLITLQRAENHLMPELCSADLGCRRQITPVLNISALLFLLNFMRYSYITPCNFCCLPGPLPQECACPVPCSAAISSSFLTSCDSIFSGPQAPLPSWTYRWCCKGWWAGKPKLCSLIPVQQSALCQQQG